MTTLLHLDSSADTQHSTTRDLTAAFADAWQAAGEGRRIVHRDLHADPPPHLAAADLHWPATMRRGVVPPHADATQRALVDELLAADALVIGVPLYNYSMPSTLKAWLDHIHVPGGTAPFGSEEPPLAGRPAVLVTARGGVYDAGTPMEGADHAVPPLRLVLGEALGMTVHVVAVNRTLAGFLPPLAAEAEAHRAEREDALTRLRELAAALS
ncbi:FMN-dependent NADH-azoreductase [Microbacterium album]|uniref:FMN dependent NADH:quinone oxidoreductase n=1 Tax=Microbacterium album TaxID=2053191 RepID=A0A917IE90_9MICO|nr:NAD(P)H-dependent oxidoreductase [Microbacterium album]GGH39632.1 FMN-dependent NADH-azoreductase [Microbacterium album]